MTARARGGLFAALAAGWAAAIFWASAQPNPTFVPEGLLVHDKILHAIAYALLAGLVGAAIGATRVRAGRAIALAVVLAAAYGATDEWHQAHVPGRDADPRDWAADATGAIVGAAAAVLALRGRTARASIRA